MTENILINKLKTDNFINFLKLALKYSGFLITCIVTLQIDLPFLSNLLIFD